MSDSFRPTKQQIRIMEKLYDHDMTASELAKSLKVTPDRIMFLITSGLSPDYVNYSLPREVGSDCFPDDVSLQLPGVSYVESVRSERHARRWANAQFWIGLFVGWFLSGFAGPKDLFEFFANLFRH